MAIKKLLNISDLTRSDFDNILNNSKNLISDNSNILDNKCIGLIFEKYSTRTRISFQVGIRQLGGNPIDIRFEDLNLQRVESFEDTFEIFGCYLDALVYRTSNHDKLITGYDYFKKPLINALSDKSHPCQIISDFYTIKNHFKTFENIVISWFGDMNNVLFSYFEAAKLYPEITINVFTDEGIYKKNIGNFPISNNINYYFDLNKKVISNSDCIMTDVFTSMNDDNQQTKDKILSKYQVNNEIMSITKPNSVFMHCLPANIDSEVTQEVLGHSKSITLTQAKNRLIAQKGILKWLNI
jgi:ornithine carbamoyltransferase